MWDDAEALNSYAWGVYEQEDDPQTIEAAIACSARSIELDNNYANNDTYSWLLYKAGEESLALEQAHKTIRIAKESGVDYTETQQLIDLITGKR